MQKNLKSKCLQGETVMSVRRIRRRRLDLVNRPKEFEMEGLENDMA